MQELQPWVEGEKHACAISKESDMILCNRRYVLCVCVRREERRETQDRLDEMKILKKMYITKEINRLVTKYEEDALYSQPLSSLTTKAHGSWGMWKLISYVL